MILEWLFIAKNIALVILNLSGTDDSYFRLLAVFVLA